MAATIASRCPLCTTPAEYRELVGGTRHHYTCPTCTSFHITLAAVRMLLHRTGRGDGVLSAMAARAGEGNTLVIQIESRGHRKRVVGRAVKTELLPT